MGSVKSVLDKRCTIRKYSNQVVADDLLNELLESAARTSTCGNMQLYSVVVTRDASVREQLAPSHFNQPASQAPVLVTFCADYNRFNKWCLQNKAVPGYDNFESFMSALVDTVALAQSFSLLAEEKGLGICYLGTTTYNPKEIAQTLKLPKMVVPVVTLSLGYPDEQPALTDRIPLKGWVHSDVYHDYIEQDIDDIYSYKNDIPEKKEFLKINNKETLAQIFTDIRYTKKDGDFFSEKLLAFVKEQGFLK